VTHQCACSKRGFKNPPGYPNQPFDLAPVRRRDARVRRVGVADDEGSRRLLDGQHIDDARAGSSRQPAGIGIVRAICRCVASPPAAAS
jgi:hypothetical protein